MKNIFVRGSVVIVVTVLALALVMAAYAQEPNVGKKKVDIGTQNIGGQGLNAPPLAGYSVLYMFTGVINDPSAREATAVHCTNFGANPVDVRVEVWNTEPGDTYSRTLTIDPGWTQTFGTQPIIGFPANNDDILSPAPGGIYQGSGRVLTKQHSNVICTAQVLDPFNDPPVFSSNLYMYRP